tara:strand:+ start:15418 stop:15726 length:309 start_codon:yes stop_codon:yes gene_type:complete
MKQKSKKRKFKNVLMEHNLITYDDKMILAERAFMANSAAQWGMGKIARDEFNKTQIDSFGKILMAYLKGRVDLFWERGMLRMEHTKGDHSNEHETTGDISGQ